MKSSSCITMYQIPSWASERPTIEHREEGIRRRKGRGRKDLNQKCLTAFLSLESRDWMDVPCKRCSSCSYLLPGAASFGMKGGYFLWGSRFNSLRFLTTVTKKIQKPPRNIMKPPLNHHKLQPPRTSIKHQAGVVLFGTFIRLSYQAIAISPALDVPAQKNNFSLGKRPLRGSGRVPCFLVLILPLSRVLPPNRAFYVY